MAFTKQIRFTPSPSTDVVGYVMFYELTGTPITLQSTSVDLGNPTPEGDGKVTVDLSLMGLNLDGDYDISIHAVDDADNLSGGLTASAVPFDFVAPDAPTDLELL